MPEPGGPGPDAGSGTLRIFTKNTPNRWPSRKPGCPVGTEPMRWTNSDLLKIVRDSTVMGIVYRSVTPKFLGGEPPFTYRLSGAEGWILNYDRQMEFTANRRYVRVKSDDPRKGCGERTLLVQDACGQTLSRPIVADIGYWKVCGPSMGFGCGSDGGTDRPAEYDFVNGHSVKTTYGCCNSKKFIPGLLECSTSYSSTCSISGAGPNADCGAMCMSGFTAYEWTCDAASCVGEYCLPDELR
jgi:hypothetical protein